MEIEELSVGDWVSYDKCSDPVRILGMDSRNGKCVVMSDSCYPSGVIGFIENVHPIPLTPKILKKNGWYNDKVDPNFWATDGVYIYNHNGVWRLRPKSPELLIVVEVIYIHELQHALRLLGVEKEIEL